MASPQNIPAEAGYSCVKSTLQAALRQTPDKANRLQLWILQVYVRVGYHKTLVAIANKHARTIWAILARNEPYEADAWQRMNSSAAM